MKTTTSYLTAIALAAALLFSSCRKDEPENTDDNNDQTQTEEFQSTPITFTATIDGGWKDIASVAVMIDNTVKEYIVWASANDDYTNATLSSDDPHYWNSSDDITVTAWWPYAGETTLPDVVVNADQSTQDRLEGSYSFSTEDQTVSYNNPTLAFTNRTARVTVTLTDYVDGLESVKLTNLSGNPTEIVMYEYDKEDFTYVALVAPQTVEQGTAFLTYEFYDAESFVDEMQEVAEWKAGEEYTYTFSLATAVQGYTYDAATNTYTVHNANGLLAWNNEAQRDLMLNCTLAADIDLTGKDWTPGNDYSNQYYGTFDGAGHTITGLTINQSGTNNVGLIGNLGEGGKVHNLTLNNVNISDYDCVGGVVGNNSGTVTNCSVSGDVSGTSLVGGVVGNNDGGTVTNCSVSGDVSGISSVGGVVGHNSGTMTACTASGSVSGSGDRIGGVVGSNRSTIIASYALGSVSGIDDVGGVVGRNDDLSFAVISCYHASGSVSGDGYVGGVVGSNSTLNVTVSACYWSDYDGDGIGNGAPSDTMEVDGEYVSWDDAVENMNTTISVWNTDNSDKQCDWKYELDGTDYPTLTKNKISNPF